MKRNTTTIAAVAAAILIGGGYTAFATSGGGHGGIDDRSGTAAPALPSATSGHDIGDDHGGDRPASGSRTPTSATLTGLTASESAGTALKRYPGAIASVELGRGNQWEVELLGRDGAWHHLKVGATSGAVHTDDRRRDEDRVALSKAQVSAEQAAAAALARTPGVVTKVDLDDDHATYWEVDIIGTDRLRHELHVNTVTAAVSEGHHNKGTPTRATTRPSADDHGGNRVGNDDTPGDDHGGNRGRGRGGDDG
ncbi:PepSY domain-containing protein [Streptomyces sp. NPDC005917]|uniref:PepSY domain-containing protein n=1 Tax=unclassified Streptomyces TaxID=2593676 RepID=UPI0033D909A7